MNVTFRSSIKSAMLVCLAILIAAFEAKPAQQNITDSTIHSSLRRFLQGFSKDSTTQYIAAFRDLNGDGTPEAIVYVVSNEWCGSGGCNTVVLRQERDSWSIVGNTSITRPPIYVLRNTSRGWHTIGVWVQGGGIQPGYEAELRFNGKTYPRNPSAPPARKIEGKPVGEVVIPAQARTTLLYDK